MLLSCASTVVEHLLHHTKIKGLSPVAIIDTWREKVRSNSLLLRLHSGRTLTSLYEGQRFESNHGS